AGIEPALFEQPVAREDWEGLGRVTAEGGVPVAADESCRSAGDTLKIARGNLATVVNIKVAKLGLVEALDVAAIARTAGIGLMVGGMVETRIAMGFSAHLAAGLGGFDFIDLDTPLLLAEDPITGGYVAEGPRYHLAGVPSGHGGQPRD
ncbi:MAG TPA: enolase C-terminal domain-like protein, partial [Haliangium sp.]|nr:enolase C-terminal domain-like protein [Haliangium sp.]